MNCENLSIKMQKAYTVLRDTIINEGAVNTSDLRHAVNLLMLYRDDKYNKIDKTPLTVSLLNKSAEILTKLVNAVHKSMLP